jgi:hypothetical protein
MAIATATVTFTAAGADSQAFTWSPALTSNPPKVLDVSVTVTVGTEGPVAPYVVGAPTNTGGTVGIAAPTDCTVTLVGSD